MKYYNGNEDSESASSGRSGNNSRWAGNRDPRRDPVALNSATGGAGPLPILETPLSQPINVTSVSLDVRGQSDETVRILLIFTAILNLPLDVVAVFNFQILRSNGTSTIPVGPTFTFSKTVAVLAAESFAFQFFDSNLEPGMYTYTVTLAPGSLIAVTPGTTITNATLSAIASEIE